MTDLAEPPPQTTSVVRTDADGSPRWRVWCLAAGWVALVLPFAIEALAIAQASPQWLIDRTPDDAYYYLEIARRIDHGQGFTFDGIHATNGFHPLWQVVLAALGLGVGGQTALLKADLLLCLMCVFVALMLMIRIVWRWVGPGPALTGALLAAHSRAGVASFADGMEGALSVLSLALLLTELVWYFEAPSRRRAALVGVISASVVLARLDMGVVICLVPLVMVWRARSWRPLPAFALGAAAGLPWALWYWFRYHHVLTTSATIKQQTMAGVARADGGRMSHAYLSYVWANTGDCVRSILNFSWAPPGHQGATLSALLVAATLGLAVLGLSRLVRASGRRPTRPEAQAAPWAFATVATMLVVKLAFDLFVTPAWANSWYLTPQRVVMPFAIGALAWVGGREVGARWRPAGVVAVAALCLVVVPLDTPDLASHSAQVKPTSWQGEIGLAAAWVQVHGPPGRYGASDAGLLGYRLDGRHPVVNLDGLVNNYRFAAMVNRGISLRQALVVNQVDVYINRLHPSELADLACARVLWTSPQPVVVLRAGTQFDSAPIQVLDVRACR